MIQCLLPYLEFGWKQSIQEIVTLRSKPRNAYLLQTAELRNTRRPFTRSFFRTTQLQTQDQESIYTQGFTVVFKRSYNAITITDMLSVLPFRSDAIRSCFAISCTVLYCLISSHAPSSVITSQTFRRDKNLAQTPR